MSSVEHILFVAGELPLATPASSIHCIHDSLHIQPEPGTQDWFLGLAIADSQLLPVSDLGAYLNGKASLGRIIEVSRSIGLFGLRIDSVSGVSRGKPVTGTHVVQDYDREYQVVDLSQLLLSERFNNIAKPSAKPLSQPSTRAPA